jgi:AmmeMemoRadiSam system protein B
MAVRQPVRAGQFYDGSPEACRRHAERLVEAAEVPADLPQPLYGGLVPHAGWTFSGAIAARTLKALLAGGGRQTAVLFGADHTGTVRRGEVYDAGAWRTPLGETAVDEDLAAAVLAAGDACRANPDAHAMEHSLEVQVPLLQVLAPELRILPVAVPPTDLAVEVGQAVARAVGDRAGEVCLIGSTDLSHHGGHFPAPGGHGEAGEKWTRANDRRMIDLVEAMDAGAVVSEAAERHNACGAGAIAATVAACKALGAEKGICLAYSNSYTIIHEKYPYELDDTTVGYAAVVFA